MMIIKNPLFEDFLASTGDTQSAIADAIGVSRGYLSEIKGGTKRPGLTVAAAIERFTGGKVPAVSWANIYGGA